MILPLVLLLAFPAFAAKKVTPVPPLKAPLSPTPALNQLRLDLGQLYVPQGPPALPASAAAMTPASWQSLRKALAAQPSREADAGAVKRIALARQVLDKFQPGEFEALPAAKQEEALAGLWENWRSQGVAVEAAAGPDAALDRLILAGYNDASLHSMGKSAFLGAAVLGYPLEDSLWIMRTRIGDALEENNLSYPAGQRWLNAGRTPEFLGTTKRAQELVDAWGAATDYARRIVEKKPAGPAPPAAKAFTALVEELRAKGDQEALSYLAGHDPTFTAFLLDAQKPGYYLYNGDTAVIARILKAKAAAALGVRRLENPDGDGRAAVYYYRPRRVVERLRQIQNESAPHAGAEKARLALYLELAEAAVFP